MRHDEVIVDQFFYRTPWVSTRGCCRIEARKLSDRRVLVIATEPRDNPGPSVTNAAEYVATAVCLYLGIDPHDLIWVEYYGYPSPTDPKRPRTYDRVTFARVTSDEEISFFEPSWRIMKPEDWQDLGIPPPAVLF